MNPNKFDVSERSAKLIYKDLIRLIKKNIPIIKQDIVLTMLRKEFEKNKNVTVPKDVEKLKRNAGKAIAETLIYFVKEDYLKNKNAKERNQEINLNTNTHSNKDLSKEKNIKI